MAIGVPDNFSYGGKKANFDRDQFTTLAEMRAYSPDFLDEGHISYCKQDKKHYKWNGTEWEEFKSGGGYEPPVGGIPKTDLSEGVQTSLGKADTALQEHQSLADYAQKSEVEGEVSTLQEAINKKANQTALEALATIVSSNKSSLDSKISALESKDAELENSIDTLSETVTNNMSDVEAAFNALTEGMEGPSIMGAIAASKTEITTAYTKAIEDAIGAVLNTPL